MNTPTKPFEGSTLQLFIVSDTAARESMIQEALRGEGDLFQQLINPEQLSTTKYPLRVILGDMDWLWERCVELEDEFKSLVNASHFIDEAALGFKDEGRGDVAWKLRHTALGIVGFNYPDIEEWKEYRQEIRVACFAEYASNPHPRQHGPIATLDGLSQDVLDLVIQWRVSDDRVDEEEVNALIDTPWEEKRLPSVEVVWKRMANTLYSGTRSLLLLEKLEDFAVRRGSQEWMIDHLRECYAGHNIAAPLDEDLEDVERAELLQEQHDDLIYSLKEARSALRLEVWWRTIQANEPHRLVKDVLTAFVENKHTPEAIRDEAQIELDFHYGEPA